MQLYELSHLLLLFFLIHWDSVNSDCSLQKLTLSCQDLEDARYIHTYHLHYMKAPSSTKILTPGNFRNLTSLRHLDLSNGSIEIIESGSFAKLHSLQILDLRNNKIADLEAGAFDGLKQLHNLKLGDNIITQLPSALMSLKELRQLDISNNPLDCNCATLKLRDALLARGVKISKKTQCYGPSAVKNVPIFKPDTKITCAFEKQDLEMQADQPDIEGSGEVKDGSLEEKKSTSGETENPSLSEENETVVPPASSESTLSASTNIPLSSVEVPVDVPLYATAGPKDDVIVEDSSSTSEHATESFVSKEEKSEESDKIDDLVKPVISTESESTESVIVPEEGSGEDEDDGSGSGDEFDPKYMPGINYNDTFDLPEDEESQVSSTTTTTTTTTEKAGFLSYLGLDILSNFNPFASSETTTTASVAPTTEKSVEEAVKDEHFLPISNSPSAEVTKGDNVEGSGTSKDVSSDVLQQTSRKAESGNSEVDSSLQRQTKDGSLESAQESKKGMGSYIVLASLLVILAALIAIAAYKGDFCRKKRKRGDVERGTEMRDMQKSLLDQNSTQPKVQISNGNTLENVPLMKSSAPPEEPKENQRSYDITPTIVTNGSSRSNGPTVELNDPIKPPRKSLNYEIEAPLNGLNPPMEDIDAPTSLENGSNEALNGRDFCERPPLSPGAQRVKITLQENPDSVPKTPMLITRMQDGENLVKSP